MVIRLLFVVIHQMRYVWIEMTHLNVCLQQSRSKFKDDRYTSLFSKSVRVFSFSFRVWRMAPPRNRVIFTKDELLFLVAIFQANKHPSRSECERISDYLKGRCSPRSIKIWFQNENQRVRARNSRIEAATSLLKLATSPPRPVGCKVLK